MSCSPVIVPRQLQLAGFFMYTLLLLVLGWLACHAYEKPVVVPVIAHGQVRQEDGSLLAARSAAPLAPQQGLPPGDKVQATAQIHLAARQPVPLAQSGQPPAPRALLDQCQRLLSCPALTVDETLVQGRNGQQDLLVSTPGGLVQGAVLAPVLPLVGAPEHPWSVGVSYGRGGWGLAAGREFQAVPVHVGVDVFRDAQAGLTGRLGVQWRF